MKRYFVQLWLFTLLLVLGITQAQAAEKLTIDDQHSYVMWRIKHLGYSTQNGKWFVQGFVELDKDQPQNSKVDVTIDISKLVTGLPELDKHLMGESFFDVKKFPKATFVSDKVDVTSDTTATVHGTLTMHGVAKPVDLAVTLNKVGKSPMHDRDTVGFSATTTIKRSDFGISAYLPNLGDEVSIEIGAEAYKPK